MINHLFMVIWTLSRIGPPFPLPALRRGWRRWKKKLDSGKVTRASTHIHHGKKAGMHRPKNSGTKRAQRHRDGHRLNPHAPRRMSLRELMIWGMIYHCFNHKTKNPSVVGWPSVPSVNLWWLLPVHPSGSHTWSGHRYPSLGLMSRCHLWDKNDGLVWLPSGWLIL